MKHLKIKILLIGIFSFLTANNLFSQKFVKLIDDMDDKEYVVVDKAEITFNETKEKGVRWGLMTSKKGEEYTAKTLSLKVVGLSCVEGTEVILLFENGEKLKLYQWNKFNCKGNVWIDLKETDIELLSNQPLKKMRVTNKRNYESLDFADLSEGMKNYYINLYKSLADGNKEGFPILKEE